MKKCKVLQKTLTLMLSLVALAGVWLYFYIFHDLPSPENLSTYLDVSGRHTLTALSDIPGALRWATVVTDDKDFYSRHSDLNFSSVFRGVLHNLNCAVSECLRIRGATIPQRLVVNLMLVSKKDLETSLRQDMRDLALTLMITQRYSHDEILELHLNSTPYSNQIYGAGEAAQFYYGKHIRNLSLAECTMLQTIAHLPHFNAVDDLEIAKARQSTILDLMVENGYIGEQEANAAKKEPLFLCGR